MPDAPSSKAEAARARIIAAMIRRLDAAGYAGASIGQVQVDAGVSRGALTHHFPTKQALTAATARRLLDAALRPHRRPVGPFMDPGDEHARGARVAGNSDGLPHRPGVACRPDA